jgi:hypothetical protein
MRTGTMLLTWTEFIHESDGLSEQTTCFFLIVCSEWLSHAIHLSCELDGSFIGIRSQVTAIF